MKALVEVLTSTTRYLKERGVASPRLDTELLLGHVLGLDRVQVYMQFDRPLTEPELESLRGLVRRRGNREPLAWVLGKRDFFEHSFRVGPGVLVPRPDTETLVEAALAWIDESPSFVADVCTGTGCIGLSIALARPETKVFLTDLSPEALACAKSNVEEHKLGSRVAVLRGDLLQPIPATRPIDWVLANPPYIPTADLAGLEPEVRDQEPRLALDGGSDGLDLYRRLIPDASRRARRGLLVELGAGQAPAVAELMREAGFVEVEAIKDLGGVERVVRGRRPA